MSKNFFKIDKGLVVKPQTTAPTTPENGAFYYNSTNDQFQFREAGAWKALGSGSGGTGDANSFLETLKNVLQDSVYGYLTPNIFSQDTNTLIDASSTGSYNSSTKNFDFSTSGKILITKQLLDSEFLSNGVDIDQVDLAVKWDSTAQDNNATYEISRNGGDDYFSISMNRIGETDVFTGTLSSFQKSYISGMIRVDHDHYLDASSNQAAASQVIFTKDFKITKMSMNLKKDTSGAGHYYYKILGDDGTGKPDFNKEFATTEAQPMADLTSSRAIKEVDFINPIFLSAGTYYFVISTDSTYKNFDTLDFSYTGGVELRKNYLYNGTTWDSGNSNIDFGYEISGIVKDSTKSLTTEDIVNNYIEFNKTTSIKVGQIFTLSNSAVLAQLKLHALKNGSPSGYLYAGIYDDNAGSPGTLLGESQAIDITTISSGNEFLVDLPSLSLKAGDYHIVLRTDDQYKSTFIAANTSLRIQTNSTGTPIAQIFDGTTWSNGTTGRMFYDVIGRELDLRVKITSSTANVSLEGLGILYDKEVDSIVGSVAKIEKFKFKAVADNLNEFTLTRFSPDPDFLKVYYVESGQVFKYGAFSLEGNKIVFPANTFNNGGTETDVTLIALEEGAGSYDNSDTNVRLLADNHLGSTDTTLDKSIVGRGILLRRPDGTLREVAIDDNDNIVIYSV